MDRLATVAVVVPTYNEARNLPELVRRLLALGLPNLFLVVVDDNSPDGTGQLAEELAGLHPGRIFVVHRAAKAGIGPAYIAGFRFALGKNAQHIAQMDADLSHAPEDVPHLLELLDTADVAVGSRYIPGGQVDRRWRIGRRVLSRLGNLYARWTAGTRVKDATSGFKAFRRRALEALELDAVECQGFAFQVELNHACQRLGFHITEYPILFHERKRGESKISWRIIWEALWKLPTLRWRRPPSRRLRPRASG